MIRFWVEEGDPPPPPPVPPPGDPAWEVEYATAAERGKRTTRNLAAVPGVPALYAALTGPAAVSAWHDRLGYAVLPDPTLWGGGVQVMPPGAALGVHLDADRHRLLRGWRRALTCVLFLSRCEGGSLVFCDPDGAVLDRVAPSPGRLVAFENSDLAYHGVETVTGDDERVTLMATFLAPATPASVRTRALFLPQR